MFRPRQETRSFDRDSGEYKRSPHPLLPSSLILTHWCPGLFWNQFFPWTSFVERLCARMGEHFQSVHSQQRLKRLFSGWSRQKNATYVQRRVCVISGGFNKKYLQQKAIDAASFDCWNSNIDQFCGIKWRSNKIPERTEVCVAVKWGALENEITASRKKRVPGTFIMEIWQHLNSEKTNLPPY